MKFIIVINQLFFTENTSLDIIDCVILDYVHEVSLTKPEIYNVDGERYFEVKHSDLRKALPILKFKSDMAVYKRLRKLVSAGFLKKCKNGKSVKKSLYSFGSMFMLCKL